MNVLIGCEHTGEVRRAFAARGHNAWSCDLLPAADHSAAHYQCDILELLERPPQIWDLFIFHPDCTYLCSSGLHWNKRTPGRSELTERALAFAVKGWELARRRIPRLCMENPIGRLSAHMRGAGALVQIIQPNQFGEDASKATALILHGLPPLRATAFAPPRAVDVAGEDLLGDPIGRPRWSNQTDSGQNRVSPSPDRWAIRAATYPGIAAAMANQWGALAPLTEEAPAP